MKRPTKLDINLDTWRMKVCTRYDTEPCKVCGKLIYFTCEQGRKDYAYKRDTKEGRMYYCGWKHFREGEPKKKVKSKFKGGY